MDLDRVDSWLPLTEYSTKYRISVSTLRRRIKTDDIKFRFEDGKYFIMDEPVGTHQKVHRPSQESELALVGAHQGLMKGQINMSTPVGDLQKSSEPVEGLDKANRSVRDEPILTAANKLLNELKKAYTQILQEKEEQIFQLKDEVSDLKTLVRVLESENERLKVFRR